MSSTCEFDERSKFNGRTCHDLVPQWTPPVDLGSNSVDDATRWITCILFCPRKLSYMNKHCSTDNFTYVCHLRNQTISGVKDQS